MQCEHTVFNALFFQFRMNPSLPVALEKSGSPDCFGEVYDNSSRLAIFQSRFLENRREKQYQFSTLFKQRLYTPRHSPHFTIHLSSTLHNTSPMTIKENFLATLNPKYLCFTRLLNTRHTAQLGPHDPYCPISIITKLQPRQHHYQGYETKNLYISHTWLPWFDPSTSCHSIHNRPFPFPSLTHSLPPLFQSTCGLFEFGNDE